MALNPARELHTLLLKWQNIPPHHSLRYLRGNDLAQQPSLRAAKLLTHVDDWAQSLDSQAVTRALPKLFDAVFGTMVVWSSKSSNTVETVPESSLDVLEMFAQVIDVVLAGNSIPRMEQDFVEIIQISSDVQDMLDTDYKKHLSLSEQLYLTALNQSLANALEDISSSGKIDLQTRIDQLIGALTRLATSDPDKDRGSKLFALLKKLVDKTCTAALGGAVSHYGPAAISTLETSIKQITSG